MLAGQQQRPPPAADRRLNPELGGGADKQQAAGHVSEAAGPTPATTQPAKSRLCHICGAIVSKALLPSHQRQCLRANIAAAAAGPREAAAAGRRLPAGGGARDPVGALSTSQRSIFAGSLGGGGDVDRSGGAGGSTGHPCTNCMRTIPHEKLASHLRFCKGIARAPTLSAERSSASRAPHRPLDQPMTLRPVVDGAYYLPESYVAEDDFAHPAAAGAAALEGGGLQRGAVGPRTAGPAARARPEGRPIWLSGDSAADERLGPKGGTAAAHGRGYQVAAAARSVRAAATPASEAEERATALPPPPSSPPYSRPRSGLLRTAPAVAAPGPEEEEAYMFDHNRSAVARRRHSMAAAASSSGRYREADDHAARAEGEPALRASKHGGGGGGPLPPPPPPPPAPPPACPFDPHATVSSAGSGTEYYERVVATDTDARPGENFVRFPCASCGRKFKEDVLERHFNTCSKAASTKRNVFNATLARVKGTELEKFVKETGKKLPNASAEAERLLRKAKEAARRLDGLSSKTQGAGNKGEDPERKPAWKVKHDSFIRMVRNARMPAGNGPYAPPDENPDYVKCDACGRRFNEAAAERHIPHCRQQAQKRAMLGRSAAARSRAAAANSGAATPAAAAARGGGHGAKRKTAGPGIPHAASTAAAAPSPSSSSRAEARGGGGAVPWCAGCGARFNATAKFCSACGGRRPR